MAITTVKRPVERPSKEEFTEAMHSELGISEADEVKQRVWTALRVMKKGLFSREKTLSVYQVTEEDMQKYEPEWLATQK